MSLNKEKNFVSAVVYLYNEENSVKKFLTSLNELLKTNFEKYEIICVNDTSTDNTAKAVEEFCDENSVKSLTMIDTSFFQGVENAMVAGLDISIGDFVFEFDSCRWTSLHVQKSVQDFCRIDASRLFCVDG